MTASNDSLNSAFTDSSAGDGDEKSQKEIPPDLEVDPSSHDDSGATTMEEPPPNNNSSFNGAATDEDKDHKSVKSDLQSPMQTSVETVDNDYAAEERTSPKKNPNTTIAINDDHIQTSETNDVQSFSALISFDNMDDATEPDNDDEKLDGVIIQNNTDNDADSVADSVVEVRSPADDDVGPSPNVDKSSAGETIDEERNRNEDVDLSKDNEARRRLCQREDSGIVNAELQTPGSSGDQPVSSSSSDGEVIMLHQAQVIVHISADATSNDNGVAGQGVRTSRRRASAESNDRSVYQYLVVLSVTHYCHVPL